MDSWSDQLGGIWREILVGRSAQRNEARKCSDNVRPKFRSILRPILRPEFRPVIKICRHNFALGNVRRKTFWKL